MRTQQLDRLLGQTPCLCGRVDTWHPACYEGKSSEQIQAAYVKVYAMIRRKLAQGRASSVRGLLRRIDGGGAGKGQG